MTMDLFLQIVGWCLSALIITCTFGALFLLVRAFYVLVIKK